jgi:hypothetical protein
MLGGKYRQTAQKDIWLPVYGAALSLAVRVIAPPLLVALWAVLVGRAAGPLLLLAAAALTAANRRVPPAQRATTWLAGLIGLGLTACWLLDAWPVPAAVLQYSLRQSLAAATAGHWLPMWSVARRAFEPMGAWLFWRSALAVALPLGTPAPWSALNWRTLTEIVAPLFAESIRHTPERTNQEDKTPVAREDSAPPTGGGGHSLF